MGKLYFRYGTVGSAKTLNLLAVAHNYRQQNKDVLLLKPQLDDRYGQENITSRAGLSLEADYTICDETFFSFDGKRFLQEQSCNAKKLIFLKKESLPSCILVDECQFLAAEMIEQLWLITVRCQVPVILYGLRTNFKGALFPAVKKIMERADVIEEVKTTCWFCNRKATHNLKMSGDKAISYGPEVELGFEDKYLPTCKNCYLGKLGFFEN